MRNVIVNVKTTRETKKKAQKLAKSMGFGLSTLLNAYLKQFIKDKTVYFTRQELARPMAKPPTVHDIKKKILPILKKHNIKRAAVFGSAARGEAGPNSDIDLLVELPESASLLDLSALKNNLEDCLKKQVDVIEYGGIKPALKDNILSEQIRIL